MKNMKNVVMILLVLILALAGSAFAQKTYGHLQKALMMEPPKDMPCKQ